jgi:2'-5' RNA ligase
MDERQQNPVTFFALWPDDATADALAQLAERTAQAGRGRATGRDRIHLTLAYLGATPPDRLPALYELAQGIGAKPFVLTLDRIGCWAHNQIAWAGASEIPEALQSLQGALSEGADAMGFPFDARTFSPHVTLARKVRSHFAAKPMRPIEWRVDQFRLMRSDFNPTRYTTIRSWRLPRPERPTASALP